MKNSLLEKETNVPVHEDSYEEWINSFSGLDGRGFIGGTNISYEILNFSEVVLIEKSYIGA